MADSKTISLRPGGTLSDTAPPPPPSGQPVLPSIPGYRLICEVGRGGSGVVYKAEHLALQRTVALKTLPPEAPFDASRTVRFRAEAEAVARLQHPNIVQIYEIGDANGRPFLALEYVEGGSLAQRLAGTPWDPRKAACLLELVARAIHYAHLQGVVHRDLKPGNILLQASEGQLGSPITPKVTDFGAAKLLKEDTGQTYTQVIVGTPHYMSPEQAEGKSRGVGPAADVYALGVILYEMLTGRVPFQASSVLELFDQLRTQDPHPPSHFQPGVPRDLETICEKCLEKEAHRRYASALELADDLRRFQAGEPVRARPITSLERLWRQCRRKPTVTGLTAALALAVVIGFAGVLAKWRDAEQLRVHAEAQRREAQKARRDAQLLAARLTMQRGFQDLEQGRYDRGLLWLARSLQLAEAARGTPDHMLRRLSGGWLKHVAPVRQVFLHSTDFLAAELDPTGMTAYAIDPGGTLLFCNLSTGQVFSPLRTLAADIDLALLGPGASTVLTGSKDKTARLWNTLSGEPLSPSLFHTNGVSALAICSDDRLLASGDISGVVYLWERSSGRCINEFRGHHDGITHLAFSTDGRILASGSRDRTVRLWSLCKRELLNRPLKHKEKISALSWSPDGKILCAASENQTVILWNPDTSAPLRVLELDSDVAKVAFSSDGRYLVTGCAKAYAQMWEVTSGRRLGAPLRHQGPVFAVCFAPDGRTLLTAGKDGTARLWDIEQILPTSRAVSPPQPWIRAVAVSRDGKYVLLGGVKAQLCELATGRSVLPDLIHAADRWVDAVDISPDGTKLATGSYDGTARLWDAKTGSQLLPPLRHGDPTQPDHNWIHAVTFSPDGRVLATGGHDGTARFWETSTGRQVGSSLQHQGSVQAVAFSPDGRILATGSRDWELRLWDVASGRLLQQIGHPAWVTAVAFSPDGRKLLSGCSDHRVRIWDVATGRMQCEPLRHSAPVYAVAFSPDGSLILTAGADHTSRLWDADSGLPIGAPIWHDAEVPAVAFSPDGQGYLTGFYSRSFKPVEQNGVARWWPVPCPATLTAEKLQRWLQVQTGLTIDANDVIVPIDRDAWRKLWARWQEEDSK